MSVQEAAAEWSAWRCYALEARYEFLKLWRMPAYALPTIAFPVMFYVLFALTFGGGSRGTGGTGMSTYLIATYGAFGVIGAALFGFGVGVAVERGQGWMTLKRATPMPPLACFAAKLLMAALFAAIIVLLLSVLGVMFGGVRLPASAWARLAATLVLGAIPFGALGLALGYVAGPNSAPAVANLVFLPMSFASGLAIPIELLPPFVRSAAQFLPPYHLGQLALAAIGASTAAPAWTHVLILAGFTALGAGVGLWGYRRDEEG
jgi:ABC-2 type transport system permease protein